MQTDLFSVSHSPAPDVWSVDLGGEPCRYSLKINPRARNVILKAGGDGGLVVVVPHRMKLTELDSIIRSREKWIRANVSMEPAGTRLDAPMEGSRMPYLGRDYLLCIENTGSKRGTVSLEDGRLTVRLQHGDEPALGEMLAAWYKEEAHRVISARAAALSGGLTYRRIRVKDTSSRWGSCTPDGDLNFCWRLVAAPMGVVDYVVVHELMHLVRPDHSRSFWRLVEARCPEHHVHRKWLRDNGRGLLRGL